ncbi:hypothetical protein ACEWY4_020853 [Coilia grayii]|uniref:C1q domain-containing protein n=1 Tax=Coilia grayii TaxID=363190 RepID=A0ABD1J926_9TELE
MKTPGALLVVCVCVCVYVYVAAAQGGGTEEQCLPQVNAVLREMTGILAEQRVELRVAKEQLEKKIKELQGKRPMTKVAFSATFSVTEDNHIGPFDKDTTLIFNHTFVNSGNAYDTNTGVFMPPVAGVYQFHYHIFAGGDNGAGARLEKNGESMVAAYNHKAPHDINTSQTVILQLAQGDKICLRLEKGWWVAAYTGHMTTFSGELLSY